MRITALVSASVAAIVLAATMGSVSAADKFAKLDGVTAVSMATGESASAADKFATLKGVTAVPMASRELDAVKGLHFHFRTPSGGHLVNRQKGLEPPFSPTPNADPSPTGPMIVGKGYRGLCGAALNSPNLSIPGQNVITGSGGGCP